MKSLTYKAIAHFTLDDSAAANNKTYDISSTGSYDPETYTITDTGVKLDVIFTVGGIVMNACYNDMYATVVSVTADEVVLDGPLRGYYDNAGTIDWYEPVLAVWDDATSAFQITAPSGQGDFIFENYNEFTKYYPGDSNWTAPLRSSKVVSYDGDVATVDWPCQVLNTSSDAVMACGNGADAHVDIDSMYAIQFWMGDGYYSDIGITSSDRVHWFEFYDAYGLSNANQSEEQLYARFDALMAQWADMLDSSYKDDSAPLGVGVFGEHLWNRG